MMKILIIHVMTIPMDNHQEQPSTSTPTGLQYIFYITATYFFGKDRSC